MLGPSSFGVGRKMKTSICRLYTDAYGSVFVRSTFFLSVRRARPRTARRKLIPYSLSAVAGRCLELRRPCWALSLETCSLQVTCAPPLNEWALQLHGRGLRRCGSTSSVDATGPVWLALSKIPDNTSSKCRHHTERKRGTIPRPLDIQTPSKGSAEL